MPSDDLKSRIEALNKLPLRNVPDEMHGLRRKLARQTDRNARFACEPASPPNKPPAAFETVCRSPRTHWERPMIERASDDLEVAALEEVVRGKPTAAPIGKDYYHIECAAADVDECALELYAGFLPLIGLSGRTAAAKVAAMYRSERLAPEDTLFLDIETTGLGNTPVFLIGTMECESDGFVFKQYFARDYSEEASILSAFAERIGHTRVLVTFNGKSFDMPYLQNRAVATAIELPHPKHHVDLLHEARRAFGRTLPNHKLQTLEQIVCGRYREDDIPGAEIPAAYHEFVRTGNARKIGLILQHNLYDLLTMADLMRRMWGESAL